jgi:Icc-related predicted phosphoesterase
MLLKANIFKPCIYKLNLINSCKITNLSKCFNSLVMHKTQNITSTKILDTNNNNSNNNKETRIYCMSDLHLEFYFNCDQLYSRLENIIPKADVLVLAGDIGHPLHEQGKKYLQFLKIMRNLYDNVILVPGNHEYYQAGSWMNENAKESNLNLSFMNLHIIDNELGSICSKADVHYLNRDSIIINDIKFIGTTMWTNIDINDKYGSKINDIGTIFTSIEKYNDEFQKCFQWLKKELDMHEHIHNNNKNENIIKNQIVITHHPPTIKLRHKKYEKYKGSSAFYSNIIDKLKLDRVKYWFSGHTHEFCKIEHNETTYVVNPLAYPRENKKTQFSSDVYVCTI